MTDRCPWCGVHVVGRHLAICRLRPADPPPVTEGDYRFDDRDMLPASDYFDQLDLAQWPELRRVPRCVAYDPIPF